MGFLQFWTMVLYSAFLPNHVLELFLLGLLRAYFFLPETDIFRLSLEEYVVPSCCMACGRSYLFMSSSPAFARWSNSVNFFEAWLSSGHTSLPFSKILLFLFHAIWIFSNAINLYWQWACVLNIKRWIFENPWTVQCTINTEHIFEVVFPTRGTKFRNNQTNYR